MSEKRLAGTKSVKSATRDDGPLQASSNVGAPLDEGMGPAIEPEPLPDRLLRLLEQIELKLNGSDDKR
jgi:hypothetical protein